MKVEKGRGPSDNPSWVLLTGESHAVSEAGTSKSALTFHPRWVMMDMEIGYHTLQVVSSLHKTTGP